MEYCSFKTIVQMNMGDRGDLASRLPIPIASVSVDLPAEQATAGHLAAWRWILPPDGCGLAAFC